MNPSNSPSSEARTAEHGWSTSKSQEQHHTSPSYVNPVVQNISSTKPKGANLTEGGFDDDPRHNVSFTSEIGSADDPGRVAEQLYQSRNAETPGEAAVPVDRPPNDLRGKGHGQRKGGQPYEVLQAEEEA
ncbi:hypothetical protein AJ78_03887 [Emergomyces pasteurianus Ep9510]|uniref:Uncharacterized protein n=1 Tax=Emergomyces pasteurianus Ep9510 TaxID=1447872 RepID=A0A1J9Q6P7_9EURO|nr:hypothetical protein AJ78_03887 [Emergomyces pasteurianus Ep9510]